MENRLILKSLFIIILFTGGMFSASAQIQFIENNGQWDAAVKYRSDAGDGTFFLEEKGYTVNQQNAQDIFNLFERRHEEGSNPAARQLPLSVRSHAYKVEFVGASKAQIIPEKALQTVNNYFYGDNPSKWVTGVKTYQAVTYKNIYPGIDLRYFMDEGQNLKYDFIVHPDADPSRIAMKYSGADNLSIQKRELVVRTTIGQNRSLRPYTYQPTEEGRATVECRYEMKGDIVRFKIDDYDRTKVLIIDPVIVFFTYSGSTVNNYGFTATFGRDGSFFGGGIVFGNGFPVSPGAYSNSFNGGEYDIGIIRLSPDGRNRLYATYLGGSGRDQPQSLIADSEGNLIIAGRTNSGDYPTVPARNPAVSGPGGDFDILVSKISADGSQLLGSMRIGGSQMDGVNIGTRTDLQESSSLKKNYGDDARSEVMLDDAGNIYVASCTQSANFPVTPGAAQGTLGGHQDGVLIKLDRSCQNILFSTFLGGSENDAAYVVAVGKSNNVYVAGATQSSNFTGISSSGVIQSSFGGAIDGFVLELSEDGSSILGGTYVGTDKIDEVYGLDVDNLGYPYIMGTTSGDMPVFNANYFNEGGKQFIWKMEPDLSKTIYSTIYGSVNAGVPNISPTAFMVDRCENVYVSGWGGKANRQFSGGNVRGMPVTADAIKGTPDPSGSDFHFFVLQKDAESQLYGTFYGQTDPPANASPFTFGDHVDGGTSRFDQRGIIYQTMCFQNISGQPFPATIGSWSPRNQVPADGYSVAMLKIEMDFTGVRANLQVEMNGNIGDSVGCIPQQVIFRDIEKTSRGKLFYWDYGDGTGDTTVVQETTHYYDQVGQYLVRLIAIDSATCNIADTVYQTIYMGNNRVFPDFNSIKQQPCENLSFQFVNTSTTPTGDPFKPQIFTWDFGDGSRFEIHDFNDNVMHTYAAPGVYNVKLTVKDVDFCNSPADTVKVVRLATVIEASFETPAMGCAPYEAVFNNTSSGGTAHWDFGDGTTSTEDSPTHLYANPGTYTVTLLASDPATCNLSDQTSFTITVNANATAAFTFQPDHPEENVMTQFTNQSLNAVTYLWDFGDGDSSNAVNPQHIFPATGTYNVCLSAINQFGCIDTTCQQVEAIILPVLDVPNAFTPGKFGINSTIGVEGFGIQTMEWSIYSRWGQKVFESSDKNVRWDGTFKGKSLPMDVYTYTLRATFVDGNKVVKTGDITLIR